MNAKTSSTAPPPPPATQRPGNGKRPTQAASTPLTPFRGRRQTAERVLIYGPGGVGKSTLASNLRIVGLEPLFLDLESGSDHLDVARLGLAEGLDSWDALRAVLADDAICDPFGALVIDTATCAEELALAWTIEHIRTQSGGKAEGIEGYGYGKGWVHRHETMLHLLADLDRHRRAGRTVVLIAHEETANVPNPEGEDYIRWEPRLQLSPKGNTRMRTCEWADHVLFLAYDVAVSKGKAMGAGTRTVYAAELPTFKAKTRTLQNDTYPMEGPDDATVWIEMFGTSKEAKA